MLALICHLTIMFTQQFRSLNVDFRSKINTTERRTQTIPPSITTYKGGGVQFGFRKTKKTQKS